MTRHDRNSVRGQSLVEFALILPVMILIAVAVGDFGRIYASMIALESATREAADYGAFDEDYWDTTPEARTAALAEMLRRACTAASSMPDYAGSPDNSTCTNPVFEFDWDTETTADYGQGPIRVIVARGTFIFSTAVSFPPLPDSVTIVRESRFAVWKVNPLESEGSPDPSIEAPPSIVIPSESPPPSEAPSESPSEAPSTEPSTEPTPAPTPEPPPAPTPEPTPAPTPEPTPAPTPEPTPAPTPEPTPEPTPP